MMEYFINGEKSDFSDNLTNLSDVLVKLGKHGDHFAVAINEIFIPKEIHRATVLRNGDKIEIVSPHPGG